MTSEPKLPTPLHRQAAQAVIDFSISSPVEAVLLVNSCARGTATAESDLDLALLIPPELPAESRLFLERTWQQRYEHDPVFRKLERQSRFARVHVDFFDGQWRPQRWDDGGGPDCFEIEIGNRVAHALPLWEASDAFAHLGAKWLPYYDEALRLERLPMVRDACCLNLDRVHSAVARELYFYAFDRLYHAFQELLQAVFMVRRVYPIAYNKWIREQVEGWLGLPALYADLHSLLEVHRLQSREVENKAEELRRLLERWTTG